MEIYRMRSIIPFFSDEEMYAMKKCYILVLRAELCVNSETMEMAMQVLAKYPPRSKNGYIDDRFLRYCLETYNAIELSERTWLDDEKNSWWRKMSQLSKAVKEFLG